MIHLCGPIHRVSGFSQTRRKERTYTNPRHPKYNEDFTIDSPNSIVGALEFDNGTLGTLLVTSEAGCFEKPRFEIHGSIGSIMLFDPNDYGPSEEGGVLQLSCNYNDRCEIRDIPILYPFTEENRGIGVADMAYAILNGRKPRVSAEIGYHAFEAVTGICKSC